MRALRIVLFTTGRSALLDGLLASGHRVEGIVHSVSRRAARAARAPRPWSYRLARSVYRKLAPGPPSLERIAGDANVPFFRMDRGSDSKLESWVRERAPDLIVVCAMVRLLGANVFRIPDLGAINVHPSLLPRHRGPDPYFWTYYHMDRETGVTVHFLDEGADTGDILLQEAFAVPQGMPRSEMVRKAMGEIAPRLLLRSIEDLGTGRARRTPQPAESPTPPARRVRPEEHRELIEWGAWPIERVHHVLAGTEPWLHALDLGHAGPTGTWWGVGEIDPRPGSGRSGTVARDSRGWYVVHSQGRIRLVERGRAPASLRERLTRFVSRA